MQGLAVLRGQNTLWAWLCVFLLNQSKCIQGQMAATELRTLKMRLPSQEGASEKCPLTLLLPVKMQGILVLGDCIF